MNETLLTIAKRYSCRNFLDKPIDRAVLEQIAEAGVQAPSAHNRQGWFISVVTDRELLSSLEEEGMRMMKETYNEKIYDRIMGRGGRLFYGATAAMFISTKKAEKHDYSSVDLGIVSQNIALAATSLGVASCHCGLASFCFMDEKRAKEFSQKLSVPEGFTTEYCVLLGYQASEGKPHEPDKSKIHFC